MRKLLTITSALVLLPAVAANAHPGDHAHLSPWQAIDHLAEPFHAGVAAALAAIVIGLVVIRRRASRVKARGQRQDS